ncbi:MAG: TonB-dependent receptor [Burkholderiaceae bacterium]|nr:TonB-dependent receptor [Burkholderiaceae bacterium]
MSRIPPLRKLPLIVAGLFFASSAFSAPLQSEVTNTQGQRIQNTPVWLLSKDGVLIATAKTDANGIARFPEVPNGHYTVEIKGSNFAAIRKEVDISGNAVTTVKLVMDTPVVASSATPAAAAQAKAVSAAPVQTANVADTVAAPAAAEVAKIEITGARMKSERMELSPKVGTTVYTIDTRMIDALGQGSDTPFNEVLLHMPGVDQDSKASGSLHVRDDHGNVQYRVDGVQLPESITGFGQSIDTRFIQQVDFVTGALPAQYGLRTAGIVDIQTKEGDVAPGGRIGVLLGNHSYYEPSAEFFGSEGKFSYYLSGSFLSNSLGIENPIPTGNAIHDQTSQSKTFGSLAYFLDDTTRLGLLFGTYSGHFEIPDNPGQSPQYPLLDATTGNAVTPASSSQINETQSEVNRFFVVSFQKSLGDFHYQASFFHQYSDLHYTPDTTADLMYLGTASDTLRSNTANGVQFDASYKLGENHTLRAGAAYTRQVTESNNTVSVFPVDNTGAQSSSTPFNIIDNSGKTGTLESLYVQDEWHISAPLTVNYGLRFDHVNAFINEQQLSPRLNVAYKLSDSTALHAGYSRYFTPPPQELASQSSINLYANTTNAPEVSTSDPVRAERTNYFDLGLSQKVDSHLTVTADAYYKKITNLIDEGQFGQALILSPFNYQMGYAKGLELSGIYNEKNWGAYLNITREKAQGRNIVSGQSLFGQDELNKIASQYIFLDHDQALSISGGVHYKIGDTQISSDLIYGSGLRNTPPGGTPNSTELPGYSTVNAALTHTWKRTGVGAIEGRLALINIFDKSYLLRDGTGVGVGAPQYGAPRTLYAGISTSF